MGVPTARELHERLRSENRAQLERAEREAIAAGKEPFDLATFERLLGRGPQAGREEGHRTAYYMFNPTLKTIAEFVALLHANETFEESR
jgi:hypothetical protein